MSTVIKFVIAAGIGWWHACRHQGQCLSKVLDFWRAMRQEKVSDWMAGERMKRCEKCKVFYAPLGTCGSPLSKTSHMGCFCIMSIKARRKTNCHIYDATRGEINPWGSLNSWPFGE